MPTTETRTVLVGLSRAQLREWVVATLGEPAYRGTQLAQWIYAKAVTEFSAMTDLPAALRTRLNECALVSPNAISATQRSKDGTVKCLLRLADGNEVECVLLPYDDRVSVCLSTQVGCAMGCRFCATAQGGYTRNLTAGEIVDQLLHLQRLSERRITHVVLMGMGEPLQNLDAVVPALRLMLDDDAYGLSRRRVTVSTSGLVRQMDKLAEQCPAVTLRIFKRDENLDIMDQYLNRGEFRSIPTFIVYDPDWNELGFYSERPEAATKAMAAESTRFARENPHLEGVNRSYDKMPDETRQAVRANSARFRWANMHEWNRIFLDELKALGMSANELAKELGVPTNRLTQIIAGKRGITGDTALRLGKWFGTGPDIWMNLQKNYELRLAAQEIGDALKKIPEHRGKLKTSNELRA